MKNSGSYPKKASNLKYHPYWRFLISQYQAAVLLIDFFFFLSWGNQTLILLITATQKYNFLKKNKQKPSPSVPSETSSNYAYAVS